MANVQELTAGGPEALLAAHREAARLSAKFGEEFEAKWLLQTDYLRQLGVTHRARAQYALTWRPRFDYRLHVRGFPRRWRSEITAWEPPVRFVDEARQGPFRRWIHEHRFEPRDGGTLAIDRVRYAVPGGALINWLLVRHDVARIFAYRSAKLRELYPIPAAPLTSPRASASAKPIS